MKIDHIVIRTAGKQVNAPDRQPYVDRTGEPEVWYYRDGLKAWTTRRELATRYSDDEYAAICLAAFSHLYPATKFTIGLISEPAAGLTEESA